MKLKNKFILSISILFILIFGLSGVSKAGSLYLNKIDFNVQINSDGSINVTETWDIDISSTNTLYKTFKKDKSKYAEITNVNVKEITKGIEKNLTKTNEWAYHVKKDYYYGTENEDDNFEIGWGVGLDNSKARKTYEISYTVKDAITKYNDYSELYWQFIGKDFEVSAKKITGNIILPSSVNNKEEIRVWGHTEGLNGTIYATDTNKIEFDLDNFKSGRYVEIRTLFPTELIVNSGRTKNNEILQTAIKEETKWADKANAKRQRKEWFSKNFLTILIVICIVINLMLSIIFIIKMIKYIKKLKGLEKYKPTSKLKYFRDMPDENATPAEAQLTLDIKISSYTPYNFGKIFSAMILDLTLKGYLKIEQEKNVKGKDAIKIIFSKEIDDKIKQDEKTVLEFLNKAAKDEKEITLKKLENYIKNHPTATESLLKNSYKKTEKQLVKEKILDEQIKKEYNKYTNIKTGYIVSAIFLFFFTIILFTIPIILFIINAVLCGKIAKRLNVLTQKGVELQEQWKGLKKYMEDFSMLDKREVPELVIWEKYLVYATAFGIADKVIKQLKIVYPNFEDITNGLTTYTYMNIMMSTNFSASFSNSITSSMSSIYSSGTGAGGGFSGGGGFGRRPEEAEAGR